MRSFGSLYQHPPRALRTSDERVIFGRALGVMADLCARDHALRICVDVWQTFCLLRATTRFDAIRFATFVDASAIGTTVLQIKDIPSRPSKFDGAICLFGLVEGVKEHDVREQLNEFGSIQSYEAGAGATPTIVRFSTHDAAVAAKRAASLLTSLCGGIDTVYNERSYDGRHGDAGFDADDGRGW